MNRKEFLPVLPYTYTKGRSIISMHSSVEEIYDIILSDPSLYINLLFIAQQKQKKIYLIKDLISFLGSKNILRYIEKFSILSLSKIVEFKKLFDVIGYVNRLKKEIVIIENFIEYGLITNSNYLLSHVLIKWENYYSINFNTIKFIKGNRDACLVEYKHFLSNFFIDLDELDSLFLLDKDYQYLIDKFIEKDIDFLKKDSVLLKKFTEKQILILIKKILMVFSKLPDNFLDTNDIIDYTMLIEEKNLALFNEVSETKKVLNSTNKLFNALNLIYEIIKNALSSTSVLNLINLIKLNIDDVFIAIKINDNWLIYIDDRILKIRCDEFEKTIDILKNLETDIVSIENLEKIRKESIFREELKNDDKLFLINGQINNLFILFKLDKQFQENFTIIYQILNFVLNFYFESRNIEKNAADYEIKKEISRVKIDKNSQNLFVRINEYRNLLNRYTNLDDYHFEDVVNILNMLRIKYDQTMFHK